MNKNKSLKNKVAIITGSSGLLGQQFCKILLKNGVIVIGIDKVIKNKINHENIFYKKIDITNELVVKKFVSSVVKKFGHIDILVNNAASKSSKTKEFFRDYESYNYSTWKEIMSVNLDAVFLLTKYVGKDMVRKKINGKIIQIASIYGLIGPDQKLYENGKYKGIKMSSPAVYSASKAAVIGLTKYLATYWGSKGIRVNAITPGGIDGGQNSTFRKKYSKRVPLGRMADKNEIEGALLYLVSDDSSYVTGQNIIIDGGFSSW
jgi:NAD(P)-dependent dehydrogenase (short-subunit alcohol dehydrogenase family)